MKIELHDGEHIIRKGHANHYEGHVINTGMLYLTNERLYFASHPLNFKKYDITMPVRDVVGMELRNHLKFFTHGFWIELDNGARYHFAVWRRKRWRKAIEDATGAHE